MVLGLLQPENTIPKQGWRVRFFGKWRGSGKRRGAICGAVVDARDGRR